MRSSHKAAHANVMDEYLELVKRFPLKTLRNEREHSEALKVLTRLLGRPGARLTTGESDYAEVLGRLIDDYGTRQDLPARGKYTPLEMLRYLMNENGMNTTDLGKVLGNKTAASLVLSGKRELSKGHIRRLAQRFRVDPGLFL
jgi:HTH-type transcriptional regulator/antitoxin HigA